MNLLSHLNGVQKDAVEYTDGPSMIIAGAGSGKTRVLTYKIAHLIEKGVDPFQIMALTFTNKAAREMKERIEHLVRGTEARNVWMGTFHSIFARILRIEAEKIGFPQNFTIYDTDDSKSIIKKILNEQQLDDKLYKPSQVLGRISGAKNNLISHFDYNNNPEILQADRDSGKSKLGMIYTIYQERLRKSSAMDFDDLLFNTNLLLRDFPEVLIKYQRRFKYFLVDEYQDTNYSQYLIVKRLAAMNENLTVVGDDAQSIYAFRGANIQNILNMHKDYPQLKTFKLEQNYRSTQNIVAVANSVIAKNKKQIEKTIWTENHDGEKIRLHSTLTENEEGSLVARSIFEIKNTKAVAYTDFAVLYRTNAQSRSIEEALRRINIPYRIYGGQSFYSRKEIKDLLSYFRVVINPNDEEALLRIINLPKRGIGQTSIDKLRVEANRLNISLWDLIEGLESNPILPRATALKIMEFATMIKSFRIDLKTKSAFDMAEHITRHSGFYTSLYQARDEDEGVMRFENMEELLSGIKEFSESDTGEEGENKLHSLEEFMQDIALHTDADQQDKNEANQVTLMTIHAAKGLEFSYVFIVGLEENLFPSLLSLNSRADIEEERRLFYVAITRGKEQVFMSYAESRYKWGNLQYSEPSRFISELDPKYIEDHTADKILSSDTKKPSKNDLFGAGFQKTFEKKPEPNKLSKKEETPTENVPSNLKKIETSGQGAATVNHDQSDSIQVGMEVYHDRFGIGKVLTLDGKGADRKATVFFTNAGTKILILRFAKLRILKQ